MKTDEGSTKTAITKTHFASAVVLKFLLGLLTVAINALIVDFAWNEGAGSAFGLLPITYSKAFLVTLMCDVLFKSSAKIKENSA